ncbi:MAG: YbfB/YjiJ family MFS transporter [Alphaproteobacteria bacterium]
MAAALGIGRFVYTPILPEMLLGFGWSASEAGLVASSNFFGYLLGALAAARFSAAGTSGRARLLAAILVSVMTTLAMAVRSELAVVLALRFVGGAASAFVIVFASTLVLERLAATGHRKLAAIHFAGVGVGIAASAVAVSAVYAMGNGWQEAWLLAGALGLMACAATALLIPREEDGCGALPVVRTAAPESSTALLPWILAYGLFGFGYVVTATFLVTMVRLSAEIHMFEAWIWLIFGLAAVPSVWLWSSLGARYGIAPAFAAACLMESLGIAVSVEWMTLNGIVLAAIFLGGTFMGITALGLAGARRISSASPQRAIALMTASFGLGQMIGPAVAGALFDELGSWRAPSLAAAAALAVAAALALAAAGRMNDA